MYLDEIVAAQKRGEAKGITSVCAAHPFVIKQTLKVSQTFRVCPLIEATCNQVNQYGGYTAMTPKDFVAYVRGLANEINFPFKNIILGGDHLGPSVWQSGPAESAMRKSEVMIRDYVRAGFTKIHLDCSMKLADDPQSPLNIEVIAQRTVHLAKVAEQSLPSPLRRGVGGEGGLRYIIGTEVPVPGGATEHEEGVNVTKAEDVKQTIEVTRDAFLREGLESAWKRVVGVVVQPGLEFGDDFIIPYQPVAARELSRFIESQPMIYEAHSTDYQTHDALKQLVRDHFAILKVGPALTFAFREAVFALAMIENELISEDKRSNIIRVLDDNMVRQPEHWKKYYRGSEGEIAFKRKYSLSDRARYYWMQPEIQNAFACLIQNLGEKTLPYSLLGQFVGRGDLNARQVIEWKIEGVLRDYVTV
jgi:D-tagatose-1,6-bisphosphate aldolase subunit GatZ/KbaZ